MKLVALMLVRNEDWVLGLTARAALLWCDALYVYLHKTSDETHAILDELEREYPGRIARGWNNDPGWPEMDMRQALLEEGRKFQGTHFAIVDADEILTANLLHSIRPRIEMLKSATALELPMVPTWRSIWHYRDDQSVWARAWLSLAFRDAPQLSWKPDQAGYQHHHRLPYGITERIHAGERGTGGVMHLQFVDWERLKGKHALYKLREAITYPDRPREKIDTMYSQALDETGLKTSRVPHAWWADYAPWLQRLRIDEPPWQLKECRRLWKEHGPEKFAGLNLFGVVP
jgi:hypothetical protein